jgi:hypothetical protein
MPLIHLEALLDPVCCDPKEISVEWLGANLSEWLVVGAPEKSSHRVVRF